MGDHDAVGNETHVDTHVDSTVDSHDDSHDATSTIDHAFDGNHVAVAGDDLDQSQELLSHDDAHLHLPVG